MDGNRATSRSFGVPETCVRDRRKQKQKIVDSKASRKGFSGPQQGLFPQIKELLGEYVLEQRAAQRPVTTELLQAAAAVVCAARCVSVEVVVVVVLRPSEVDRKTPRLPVARGYTARIRTGLSETSLVSTMSTLPLPKALTQRRTNSLDQEKENFEKSQAVSISKAINSQECPVKEKHVRSILFFSVLVETHFLSLKWVLSQCLIIGTFHEKGAHTFWSLVMKLPLQENPIVCWKCCHVVHKLLREGYHRGLLKEGYGKLIQCYCRLIVAKLNFHYRNPKFPGNLTVTDEALDDIGEGDVNVFFQLTCEMFDYMDEILALQQAVFGSLDMARSNSMTNSGQCRLAPLIPCIQDSSQLYDYTVKVLFKLHADEAPLSSEDESLSLAAPHSALSFVPYSELRMEYLLKAFSTMESGKERQAESTQPQTVAFVHQFYLNSVNLQYFKHLIQVPLLPEKPPNFLIASDLSSHVSPVVVLPPQNETPENETVDATLVDTSVPPAPDKLQQMFGAAGDRAELNNSTSDEAENVHSEWRPYSASSHEYQDAGPVHRYVKTKVIEFAKANGAMTAQQQFRVSEKSVRYWRNQKSKLLVCNTRKTSFRGRRALHLDLEDKVADFIREYRARSLPVNAELIQSKAVKLAHEAGLSKKDFKGFIYWFLGILHVTYLSSELACACHPLCDVPCRDRLIARLLRENSELRMELQRVQLEDQRYIDDLKRHVVALEAQVAEHERTIRHLNKVQAFDSTLRAFFLSETFVLCLKIETEALQTTASTGSDASRKAEEAEKRAKSNEEKFHKMKEVYNQLREEHIVLLRAKADIEKQLVSAKVAAEGAEKVRQDLGEQLRQAREEKRTAEEQLGGLAARGAEAETLTRDNQTLRENIQ
ncbi:hypothetical protein HPB51_004132 [Rhipicephalus microplus]|uniref:ENTH domain-containing protein n=1 Tax=Rhipicephalus microplus TaxID=6941 RepID=A0A9J6EXG4_RHIMP|nr:hypothetical protein HPB51_004132 [Rhipicephalus microplus]